MFPRHFSNLWGTIRLLNAYEGSEKEQRSALLQVLQN